MSIVKSLMGTIKALDSFGVTIDFRINKQDQYKSHFGGIITFFYICFGIAFLLANFKTFYGRTKMTLNYTEKVHVLAPFLNYSAGRSGFAFGLVWENNSHINDIKYFDLVLSAVRVSNTLNKTKISIPFSSCNESDFFNDQNSTFHDLNI